MLDDHRRPAGLGPGGILTQHGSTAGAPLSRTQHSTDPPALANTLSASILAAGSLAAGIAAEHSAARSMDAIAEGQKRHQGRFRTARKLPLHPSRETSASAVRRTASGQPAGSARSTAADRRQVSFQLQQGADAEGLAVVFSEPSLESLPDASAGIGAATSNSRADGPATIMDRATAIQEQLRPRQLGSGGGATRDRAADVSWKDLEACYGASSAQAATVGAAEPTKTATQTWSAGGAKPRPQTSLGLRRQDTHVLETTADGRTLLRPRTAPQWPRAAARPPRPRFAPAVLEDGAPRRSQSARRGSAAPEGFDTSTVLTGSTCVAREPMTPPVLLERDAGEVASVSTQEWESRVMHAVQEHLRPAGLGQPPRRQPVPHRVSGKTYQPACVSQYMHGQNAWVAIEDPENATNGRDVAEHLPARKSRDARMQLGRGDGLADAERSHMTAPATAAATLAPAPATSVAAEPPAAPAARVALRGVPPHALLPPAAAVAVAAVAAAPGGAAALASVSRGAVPHALTAAGGDLGVAIAGRCGRVAVATPSWAHGATAAVGGGQHGTVHSASVTLDMLLLDACRTLGCLVPPLLYVRGDPVARAYYLSVPMEGGVELHSEGGRRAVASWRLQPAVVVTSAALDALTQPELRALFGAMLTHAAAPCAAGVDLAAPADCSAEAPSQAAGRSVHLAAELDHVASRSGVPLEQLDASWLHARHARTTGVQAHEWGGVRQRGLAAIGAVATVAAVAELAPGALEELMAGWGRSEGAEAAEGPSRSVLGGMRAAAKRQLGPALRLARQLLRFAEDRGAMLVAQVRWGCLVSHGAVCAITYTRTFTL